MMPNLQMGVRSAVAQLEETGDRRAAISRLTIVTVVCPWARQSIRCLVIVQPRKTGTRPSLARNFDWDVKHQQKQKMDVNQSIRCSDVTKYWST